MGLTGTIKGSLLQNLGLCSAFCCSACRPQPREVWAEVAKLGTLVSFPGMEVFYKRHRETGVKQRNRVKPRQNWVASQVLTGRGGRHGAYQTAATPFSWGPQSLEASSRPKKVKQTSPAELGGSPLGRGEEL